MTRPGRLETGAKGETEPSPTHFRAPKGKARSTEKQGGISGPSGVPRRCVKIGTDLRFFPGENLLPSFQCANKTCKENNPLYAHCYGRGRFLSLQ
jgi:hypothetical protein